MTEEILSSGIGKKYLDTIIKRLAGLYTDREDIVNRFALLSGIVGDSEELLFRFCSDDETIGLVQEIYGTKVNKGICCVFRYNNLPAKNVLPEYVCDYKKRAGLFQRSADLE